MSILQFPHIIAKKNSYTKIKNSSCMTQVHSSKYKIIYIYTHTKCDTSDRYLDLLTIW